MTCRITVWTPVTDKDVAAATALVRHLDSQTSAVSEWELVLATSGGDHVAALERTAARRPNVRVVVDDVDRARAGGEWVLELGTDDRLEPAALRRLAALASEADAEDVLVVRPARVGPDEAATPLVLTRSGGGGARAGGGARDAGEAGAAEHVVPVPLRGRRAPWTPDPATAIPAVTAQARWVDGVLELHGRALLHARGAARAQLVLVGRHHGSVRSVQVDAFTVSGDDEDTEPSLEWSARIDITRDDVDDELEVWLQVEPTDTDDEENEGPTATHRSPLVGRVSAPAGVLTDAPAVIDGRLVCARADEDALVIDVGANGRSLLGPLDPRQASVVEDVTGSRLTIRLPQLAHRGPARVIGGALVLDGHTLPARLVVDDEPRVECHLAGLPGSAVLECSFGRGPAAATGCAVLVSRTGEFTVVATRAQPPDPSAVADDVRPGPRPRASGPVAALRRHLPHGVDPVVAKLSKVPAFRVAYRRVTGLR